MLNVPDSLVLGRSGRCARASAHSVSNVLPRSATVMAHGTARETRDFALLKTARASFAEMYVSPRTRDLMELVPNPFADILGWSACASGVGISLSVGRSEDGWLIASMGGIRPETCTITVVNCKLGITRTDPAGSAIWLLCFASADDLAQLTAFFKSKRFTIVNATDHAEALSRCETDGERRKTQKLKELISSPEWEQLLEWTHKKMLENGLT